ncbi:Na+/H+ antiporter NhaA [Owenweeksia hongkongensis]|uniref:Na+/H+ antiporter NhaA n=1 Tax=Owenweeksia hongkongensis TaxID=253245 RepID=UPI003A8EB0A2
MIDKKAPIDYLTRPVKSIFSNEATIGVLLFLSAVAAMVVANSSWGGEWYEHLWEKEITISFDDKEFGLTLHYLINDGLMAIFFFLVGLEIKREVIAGELSTWKKASMPIAAAIGGMAVPALIFIAFNPGETGKGWGIPMATDIAFALGLINLVRRRIAPSVKVFITSLAVVDDIGAVLVIAFFYTSSFDVDQLYIAGGAWVLLMAANRLGIRNVFFYTFIGISGIWVAFFYSGIHPTIAGILLAFTIPAKYRITKDQFTDRLKILYRKYLKTTTIDTDFNTEREDYLLKGIRSAGDDARTPLQKIEHGLFPFVYFVIMPIFAFANAGLKIEDNFWAGLVEPIGLGIIFGLIVGKFVGISLVSRLMVAMGLAQLPEGSSWKQIYGTSILAGIGFTMSLFISELAFVNREYAESAKSAILVASILAGVIGLLVIRFTNSKKPML